MRTYYYLIIPIKEKEMTKKSFLILCFFFAFLSVSAQRDEKPFSSPSVSVGLGFGFFKTSAVHEKGFNGQITCGGLINSDLAVRVRGMIRPMNSFHTNIICDMLWDPVAAFNGNSVSRRRVYLYPMVGFGAAIPHKQIAVSDYDFALMAGLLMNYRLNTNWAISLEAKYHIMPHGYDGNSDHSSFFDFTTGVRYAFGDNLAGTKNSSRFFDLKDDWFFAFSVGPSFSVVKGHTTLSLMDRIGGEFDLTVGRNLNTYWTLRCCFSLQEGKISNGAMPYLYRFYDLRGDIMFNVSNLYSEGQIMRLNVLPYTGVGFNMRFDQQQYDLSVEAGMMLRWYVSASIDVCLDGRFMVVPPRFNGGVERWINGYVILNAGVIYNLSPSM